MSFFHNELQGCVCAACYIWLLKLWARLSPTEYKRRYFKSVSY